MRRLSEKEIVLALYILNISYTFKQAGWIDLAGQTKIHQERSSVDEFTIEVVILS